MEFKMTFEEFAETARLTPAGRALADTAWQQAVQAERERAKELFESLSLIAKLYRHEDSNITSASNAYDMSCLAKTAIAKYEDGL